MGPWPIHNDVSFPQWFGLDWDCSVMETDLVLQVQHLTDDNYHSEALMNVGHRDVPRLNHDGVSLTFSDNNHPTRSNETDHILSSVVD